MANIIWTPPDGWVEESGAHVSFKAPCDCSAAGNLVIGSNSYSIVDAIGGTLIGASGVFVSGAVLDFILDCENSKAYLQNSALAGFKQGTWTPTAQNGGAFSEVGGNWYKIGKLVFIQGYFAVSASFTANASVAIGGLPFKAALDAILPSAIGNLQAYTASNKSEYMDGYAGWYVGANSTWAEVKCFKYGRIWGQNWNTLGTGWQTFAGVYMTND